MNRHSGCWGLLVAVVLMAACAGPARTATDYRLKARTSAKSALSAVETASLAARLVRDKGTLSTYVSVVLDSAERDVSATQSTFASIQSPSRASDKLRQELGQVLNSASDTISSMRIAARRDEWPDLLTAANALPALAQQLQQYSDLSV